MKERRGSESGKTTTCLAALCLLWLLLPGESLAHHAVVSLGAAGMEGPGAPIETSTSQTLPKGSVLGYLKLDHATFDKFTPARDDESEYSEFWLLGTGYGFTPYLSTYLFFPFNTKVVEDNSYNTSGLADLYLTGVLGFKYDDGLKLLPEKESLDDMEDWHFTINGGLSLPTGDPNVRDRDGNIDPGMSLGFGKPAFGVGATATKTITPRLTFIAETGYIYFQEYRYDDGNRTQFGDEFRFNVAPTYRLLTHKESKFRIDAILEFDYLMLGRDVTNGVGELATGGQILYLLPGVRTYWKSTSAALGFKLPVWTDLNEEEDQQGAEGTENYRFIFTFSVLL